MAKTIIGPQSRMSTLKRRMRIKLKTRLKSHLGTGPPEFLAQIRDAARYGGTEFLALIIQASEAITTRTQGNLPDPIAPNSI